jgi:hypothetical protein
MKKLVLFLSIALLTQCTPPAVEQDCQCFEEIVYLNDGTDVILIDRIEADQNKCDKWGYGESYLPMRNSDFHNRFIEICE